MLLLKPTHGVGSDQETLGDNLGKNVGGGGGGSEGGGAGVPSENEENRLPGPVSPPAYLRLSAAVVAQNKLVESDLLQNRTRISTERVAQLVAEGYGILVLGGQYAVISVADDNHIVTYLLERYRTSRLVSYELDFGSATISVPDGDAYRWVRTYGDVSVDGQVTQGFSVSEMLLARRSDRYAKEVVAHYTGQPVQESTAQSVFNFVYGFFKGGYNAVAGTVEAVAHPIDTVMGIATAVMHPVTTWEAAENAMAEKWASSEGKGEIAFEWATVLLAAAKLGKVRALSEAGQLSKAESLTEIGKARKLAATAEKMAGQTDDVANAARKIVKAADDLEDVVNAPNNVAGTLGKEIPVPSGRIINIPGVGNLDLTASGVDSFMARSATRINQKLGEKIGQGRLPFPTSKDGFLQAKRAVEET